MTLWVSSDLHLWHENIIRYGGRPFKNVNEMNEALRENHNSLVKPSDHWYFLGDLTMLRGGGKVPNLVINEMKKWHGHKRIILGNHDHLKPETYSIIFEKIRGTGQWMDGILFSHYPVHPTSIGRAQACVHGHIHQNPSPPPVMQLDKSTQRVKYKPYINVSVEAIGYKPISLEQIKDMIAKGRGQYEDVKYGHEVTKVTNDY